MGSPGVSLQRTLVKQRMSGSSEGGGTSDGGGLSDVPIAALAGTTAIFGTVTVTLTAVVVLLYLRHSRKMKRNRSDVKKEKGKTDILYIYMK